MSRLLGSTARRYKLNNSSNPFPEVFGSSTDASDLLWRYVQAMSPETVSQLSKPTSPEVLQVMERNVIGLLGSLPSEHFDVEITTSREHLGRLLASAMISGYFLRNAEQRMTFEKALLTSEANSFDAE